MKDELSEKIMTKFVGLRSKTYNNSIDDGSEDKKAKDNKKVCHKKKVKFEDYKDCLEAAQLDNKINDLRKNKMDNKKTIIQKR